MQVRFASGGRGSPNTYQYDGIDAETVQADGAGGGGDGPCPPGSANGLSNVGGAGGWVDGVISVTPGDQYTVDVGSGGTGSTSPTGAGATAGTATDFIAPGGTVLAFAGGGGAPTPTDCNSIANYAGPPGAATLPGGMAVAGSPRAFGASLVLACTVLAATHGGSLVVRGTSSFSGDGWRCQRLSGSLAPSAGGELPPSPTSSLP
jgi:hypothetical protein